MTAGPVIRLRQVHKHYDLGSSSVHALRGIDLDIQRGEYVGVMGPSGSGKTTLMEVVGCLSKPTTGSYEFEGAEVAELDDASLAMLRGERIGFVFQSFSLLPRLTAVENTELPMLYNGVGRRERRERALHLLSLVGLAERAHHRPNELSGGQRQRVAIARALANRPSILLADEPTGALDSATGQTILALLEQLHAEGQTVVVVTHDASVGARTRRLVRLRDGLVAGDERRDAAA